MKLKAICFIAMTFVVGSLYPQQKFAYRTIPWDDELNCLCVELEKYRNNTSPEAMAAVYGYLSDKPVQILLEQQVWKVVGPFITTDPYSNSYAYVCTNINKYPRADQTDILSRMNTAMARAVAANDNNPEQLTVLRENIGKHVFPKSTFYMAKLDIDESIRGGEFGRAFDIAIHADDLGVFHKEERYLFDTYRIIAGSTPTDKDLAQKILGRVLRMQADSRSRIDVNVHDIISVCYRSLGEDELADRNMKIYQDKYDRYQDVNREFLEMIRRVSGDSK